MKSLLTALLALAITFTLPYANAATKFLNDRGTVVVVAHPDDELLWDPTLLKDARAIVVAGPAVSYTKRDAINQVFVSTGPYGYKPVHFAFPPVPDSEHIADAAQPCYRDLAKYDYYKTYDALRPILQTLKNKGMTRVATHNPWGEYGHPNHRTVSAVVRNLGAYDLIFDVWHNSVVHTMTTKTIAEGARYLEATFLTGVTYSDQTTSSLTLFKMGRGVYQRKNVWTWHNADTEYASGYRRYWRIVENGRNLLADNPALLQQVQKIRMDIPYAPGEQFSNFKAHPWYVCQNAQSTPVYY